MSYIPKILTDDISNRVRAEMGLDVAYLSDDVITSQDFMGIAESNIIESVANYEDIIIENKADKIYLEKATVCECARLLAPGMLVRLPKSQKGLSQSHELENIDWDKQAEKHADSRDENLNRISSYEIPIIPFLRIT